MKAGENVVSCHTPAAFIQQIVESRRQPDVDKPVTGFRGCFARREAEECPAIVSLDLSHNNQRNRIDK